MNIIMIALTVALSLAAAANPTASFETTMGSFTAELYMDRVVNWLPSKVGSLFVCHTHWHILNPALLPAFIFLPHLFSYRLLQN